MEGNTPESSSEIYDLDGTLDYIELFCDDCASEGMGHNDESEYEDHEDDSWYDADTLASCGMGTDEDYGDFGHMEGF